MPSMFQSAPNDKSVSLLSKAWQYLQPKASKESVEAAEVYRKKSKDLFPNEIYPELSKPCVASNSKAVDQSKSMVINNSITSPRLSVKRYRYPWTKQLNTENTPKATEKGEDESEPTEDEGIFTVELIKHPNGYLGIVLVGGIDTPLRNHYVNSILPSSSASKSGRVRVGDELLEVNGHDLKRATHAEALRIFRCLPSVVKLVIMRKKDANRSLLELLVNDSAPAKKNNNLSSDREADAPKSAYQAAADTSVVPKSVSSVVDVTKRSGAGRPAVGRVSRCSSFLGVSEDEQSEDSTSEEGKVDLDASSLTDEEFADWQGTSSWLTRRNTICGSRTPLQTLSKGNTQLGASPFVRGAALRHSLTSGTRLHSDALKQKAPYPWEQTKSATLKGSSSAKMRGSAAVTAVQNGKKSGAVTTGKNCQIEKETLVVQIRKEDAEADWGFTVGGGLFSPYGDLAIYVVDVSSDGPVCGVLKPGDEIVEFNGGSLGALTLTEAERTLGKDVKDATVTIKRKYLQRTGSVREQSNPYVDTWSRSSPVLHRK